MANAGGRQEIEDVNARAAAADAASAGPVPHALAVNRTISRRTGAAAPALITGNRHSASLESATIATALTYAPKLPICLRVNTFFSL